MSDASNSINCGDLQLRYQSLARQVAGVEENRPRSQTWWARDSQRQRLTKPLPDAVRTAIEAYIGCIPGASLISDLRQMLTEAGLVGVGLPAKPAYVETLTAGDHALYRNVGSLLPAGSSTDDYITSMDFTANKPTGACCIPVTGSSYCQ